MRLALTLLLLLAAPATASAAQLSATLQTDGGVRYGQPQRLTGTLTEAGAPLAGQLVRLEARTFPFAGGFGTVASTTTNAKGAYAFSRAFDRNVQLRAYAPDQDVRSVTARAFVFPAVKLSFEQLGPRRLRLIETLRTPTGVRLTAPVTFYLAPKGAATAPPTANGTPARTAPGRFRATARVTIPKAWKGEFRYGSCFRYSKGTGMGDPKAACPKRYRF
jgi:hypothetical protein